MMSSAVYVFRASSRSSCQSHLVAVDDPVLQAFLDRPGAAGSACFCAPSVRVVRHQLGKRVVHELLRTGRICPHASNVRSSKISCRQSSRSSFVDLVQGQ